MNRQNLNSAPVATRRKKAAWPRILRKEIERGVEHGLKGEGENVVISSNVKIVKTQGWCAEEWTVQMMRFTLASAKFPSWLSVGQRVLSQTLESVLVLWGTQVFCYVSIPKAE